MKMLRPPGSSRVAALLALAALVSSMTLLSACGGGGGSEAPAGADQPTPAPAPGPAPSPSPGAAPRPRGAEALVEKGAFWERGAGVRASLAHLLSDASRSGAVQALSAQEAAWVQQRAAQRAAELKTTAPVEPNAKVGTADAALSATATPKRTLTGLQTVIYHRANGTTILPLNLTNRDIEAYVPDGAGGFQRIPATAKRADGTYAIADVPEGPHWIRLGTRWVWTSAGFVDWSADFYGRPDVAFPAASTPLVLNAGNLSPWQSGDGLAWVVPFHGTSFEFTFPTPGITNPPRPGEVALGSFGLDFASPELSLPLLEAAKGDAAYLNQLVASGANPATAPRVLARSMVLPAVTMTEGATTTVNSGFLDIAPSAKVHLRWPRSAFARFADVVSPGAVFSDSLLGLSAFALPPTLGVPFDAYSLVEFNGAGTTDIDFGALRYGHPFPPDWNRTIDAFVAFRKNYLAPGATVSEPLVRGLSTVVLIDPATLNDSHAVINPGVSPPRGPEINGRTLFNNQLAVGTSPTLSWHPPEVGVADYYFIRVLELRADGTRSVFVPVARLTTENTSMVLPPGLLEPGKLYVITIAANKSGTPVTQPNRNGLPFSFGTMMSAIVSP
jgi:hypothetical protein